MKEKLIELLTGKSIDTAADVEYVADFLLENGVVVMPCKVGTPVFIINKKGQIFCGKFRLDDIDQFGKRVFLTKEEAEAALKPKNSGLSSANKEALLNSFMKKAE